MERSTIGFVDRGLRLHIVLAEHLRASRSAVNLGSPKKTRLGCRSYPDKTRRNFAKPLGVLVSEMNIGRAMKVAALAITLIFFLPVGSIEDRSIVITILLISRTTTFRFRLKQLQDRIGVDAACCFSLSLAWIVWAWGNSRARLGHGLFHMIDVPGVWRGYPFMYEEWIIILNPTVKTWREFHWLGMVADVAILSIASFWIVTRFSSSQGNMLPSFIVVPSALFAWLNVEPWVDGVPVTLRWPVPGTWSDLTYGYPYRYTGPSDLELRTLPLVTNIAIGCVAWVILFAILRVVAERGAARPRRPSNHAPDLHACASRCPTGCCLSPGALLIGLKWTQVAPKPGD